MTDFTKEAKVGDKVESIRYGIGEIVTINLSLGYPVGVKFGDCTEYFTVDGKYNEYDNTPDLYWSGVKVIDGPAPKRKVKKEFKFVVNFYNEDVIAHMSKMTADNMSTEHRIACKEYTEVFEVEE